MHFSMRTVLLEIQISIFESGSAVASTGKHRVRPTHFGGASLLVPQRSDYIPGLTTTYTFTFQNSLHSSVSKSQPSVSCLLT